MDRYRIYLRGELAKLRHAGDARDLLNRGRCGFANLGLPSTIEGLTAFFATQNMVDGFVAGLADHQTVDLAECCDRWRDNGIATKLATLSETRFVPFSVDRILLREAERCLVPLFSRHEFRLPAVATDPELLAHDPYRDFWIGRPVDFQTCLAEPAGPGWVRLIDGVHRAIQMFRNGQQEIPVCLVSR